MKLYMAITADKYELPVFLTDTVKEMAQIYGVKPHIVQEAIYKKTTRRRDKVKFIRIEVE